MDKSNHQNMSLQIGSARPLTMWSINSTLFNEFSGCASHGTACHGINKYMAIKVYNPGDYQNKLTNILV